MTALQMFMAKIAKAFICNLRESTYDDMAHQASDWIPEEARIEKNIHKNPPIKLDFAVPKKHRLAWISRTIQHFPH